VALEEVRSDCFYTMLDLTVAPDGPLPSSMRQPWFENAKPPPCRGCAVPPFAANLQVGSGIFAGTNQVLGAQAVYGYGHRGLGA